MLDTTDDIAEGISFQAFEDDCRLLATLLHDVLLRELGPRFIHILERYRILAQVPPIRSAVSHRRRPRTAFGRLPSHLSIRSVDLITPRTRTALRSMYDKVN